MRYAVTRFNVSRITAATIHKSRFARIGKRHKLGAYFAANLPAISLNSAPLKRHPIKHACIRGAGFVVGFLKRFLRVVEAVPVVHNKLARTHKPKSWANFITILHLLLIQVHRQLFVGTHLVAHQRADELFMRGPKAKLHVVPVDNAHKLGAVIIPPAAFVP